VLYDRLSYTVVEQTSLDTSVAGKWFNMEDLSEKAVEIKEAYVKGDLELTAPMHMIYEVGNSIWKNPQLTEADASNAVASLLQLSLQLLEPTAERASRAIEIARSSNITFYDAVYLQTAEELNIALVTDDRTQITAGKDIANVISLQEVKL